MTDAAHPNITPALSENERADRRAARARLFGSGPPPRCPVI
jgi:hypothetical protein